LLQLPQVRQKAECNATNSEECRARWGIGFLRFGISNKMHIDVAAVSSQDQKMEQNNEKGRHTKIKIRTRWGTGRRTFGSCDI
jgi:hypothetical protein